MYMARTRKQGQNYFGDSNFGVNGQARANAGLSTSSNGKPKDPPKNHRVAFKPHPATKKLNGKPMG